MKYFSIMPLDTEHLEEICRDIEAQYQNKISDCALFKMTLVPEGNPPADKASILCEKYKKFQNRLRKLNVPNGILVQASIGHGWKLGELFPFEQYINLTDGKPQEVCCPEDDAFCKYIQSVMQTLAKTNPDLIMVDDDFRLMFRDGRGCACQLHMQAFNRLAGTALTREELVDILAYDKEHSQKYYELFAKTQEASLIKAAKAMRAGIDLVNPDIPGAFCGCGSNMEAAAEIAKILAGENHPVILRINNGNYLTSSGREFSRVFFRAASQITKVRDKVDIILDEPDTCPQNRYSTSAKVLHAHHVGTILEGAVGAKHWITRLASYEPASGVAYRQRLKKYYGFYNALAGLVPSLSWKGCRIPLSRIPYYDYSEMLSTETDGWSNFLLERLGLPMYYSAESGGAVFLEGDADKRFSDTEIAAFFRGTVFLTADAAKRLCDRGFGNLIGVSVREWNGKTPMSEQILLNKKRCPIPANLQELVPEQEETQILSVVSHTVDHNHYTSLFPGSTKFSNKLGGTTVVFCGTPNCPFGLGAPFSFLNESRKEQFVALLKQANALPVYYPEDAEIYLRVADMPNDTQFCAVFNLGLDTLEEIPLICEKNVSKVEMLLPDGSRMVCPFRAENNRIVIETVAETLEPVILFLS